MTRFRFTPASSFGLCVFVVALVLPLAPQAADAAQHHASISAMPLTVANPAVARDCHHVEVQLSDTTATLTCADQVDTQASWHGIQGHTADLSEMRPLSGPGYDNGCTQPAHNIIHLYADANETGDSLCVYGNSSGWLNLYDVPHGFGGIYGTWNDIASSYAINGYTCIGVFAINGNGGGTTYTFVAPETNNFDGVGGRLPNDSLSSVGSTSGC